MKHPRKINWIIVVIVILLIVALFFARNKISKPNGQVVGDTGRVNPAALPSPTELTFLATETLQPLVIPSLTPLPPDYLTHVAETQTAEPTMSPTATSTLAPALCTFPLAQITNIDSKPEKYSFSEPKVVLTAAEGNIYHIAEWLPDNQRVLMTEELFHNVVIGNDKPLQESIELYNPESSVSKVYAIRANTNGTPLWLRDLNAVVYPTINYTSLDRKNHISKFTRQVWVSYGDPDSVQKLDDDLPQFPLAIKPDGSEIAYLSDKKLSKLDKSLTDLPSVPIDPARWDYAKRHGDNRSESYEMAWQPGTSLIFLYSDGAMYGSGYTFILNTDTGHVCELKFGGWAQAAHWSSNGRYLAIVRASNYSFPIYTSDLTVLDTTTGNLTTLAITPHEIESQNLYDFVWTPDNQHLLAIGSFVLPQSNKNESNVQGLYLVDIVSGQSVPVVPEYKGHIYSNENKFAWSPDGSKLVIHCPTHTADQICLISVKGAG
jgi:WD40-like Beta Propeller Repeat